MRLCAALCIVISTAALHAEEISVPKAEELTNALQTERARIIEKWTNALRQQQQQAESAAVEAFNKWMRAGEKGKAPEIGPFKPGDEWTVLADAIVKLPADAQSLNAAVEFLQILNAADAALTISKKTLSSDAARDCWFPAIRMLALAKAKNPKSFVPAEWQSVAVRMSKTPEEDQHWIGVAAQFFAVAGYSPECLNFALKLMLPENTGRYKELGTGAFAIGRGTLTAARKSAPEWKLGPEWQPVREAALAQSGKDRSNAGGTFEAMAEASPEALKFCQSVIQEKDTDTNKIYAARRVIEVSGIRDDLTIKMLIDATERMQFPSENVTFLAKMFPDHPAVKTAILKWAESNDPKYEYSVKDVLNLKLSREEARAFLTSFIAALQPDNKTSATLACSLMSQLNRENPELFKKVLTSEQAKPLLPLIRSKDPYLRSAAIFFAGWCAEKPPIGLAAAIIDAFEADAGQKPPIPKSGLLALLGLLPAEKHDQAYCEKLFTLAQKCEAEGRAGLYSWYWRCGGDINTHKLEFPKDRSQPAWFANGHYWGAAINCAGMGRYAFLIPPERWRSMPKAAPDMGTVRAQNLAAISMYPDAPDAGWMIEQGIADQSLHTELLNTLWGLRSTAKRWADTKGLRDFLSAKASDKETTGSRDPATAAGLLFHLYGDSSKIQPVIQSLKQDNRVSLLAWTRLITVILEADSKNAFLDEYQQTLAKEAPPLPALPDSEIDIDGSKQKERQRSYRSAIAGRHLLAWLLKLCRGQEPGSLPPEGVAMYLRDDALDALDAFMQLREKASPYLDQLRDPALFFEFHDPHSEQVMTFIGTLDWLEQQRKK